MKHDQNVHKPRISVESINATAESMGISYLPADAAQNLAIEVNCQLKQIIQDAVKFMHNSKNRRLTCQNFNHSLKVKNIEPLTGFSFLDLIPFKMMNAGGCDLFSIEEDEIELSEALRAPLPKLPLDISLKPHWLSIDGVQPAIPENPPPVDIERQKLETIDPTSKLKSEKPRQISKENPNEAANCTHLGTICVKHLAAHELSAEQQIFYKTLTETCVGPLESQRMDALRSLAFDPGMHQLLPALSTFIAEGVRVNTVQHNMNYLNHLLRMVQALMDNTTIYLEKYLHEIIPSVLTCIVCKQICARPDTDNHWLVREFASRLLAKICRKFHTNTNGLQVRMTKLLSSALQNNKLPLVSHYGAIAALSELGQDVMKSFVIPRLKPEGERIKTCIESLILNNFDKIGAERIITLITLKVVPVIKTMRQPPDNLDEYKNDFGYLGPTIHAAVIKLRQPPIAPRTIFSTMQPRSIPTELNLPPSIVKLTTPMKLSPTMEFKISSAATTTAQAKPSISPISPNVPAKSLATDLTALATATRIPIVTQCSSRVTTTVTESIPTSANSMATQLKSTVSSTLPNIEITPTGGKVATYSQRIAITEPKSSSSSTQPKPSVLPTLPNAQQKPISTVVSVCATTSSLVTQTISPITTTCSKLNSRDIKVSTPSQTMSLPPEIEKAIANALGKGGKLPTNIKVVQVVMNRNQISTALTLPTQTKLTTTSQMPITGAKLPPNVKYVILQPNKTSTELVNQSKLLSTTTTSLTQTTTTASTTQPKIVEIPD